MGVLAVFVVMMLMMMMRCGLECADMSGNKQIGRFVQERLSEEARAVLLSYMQ